MDPTLVRRVQAIHQYPQTQSDVEQQLQALHTAANKLGLYDAADWLRDAMRERVSGGNF